MAGPGDPGVHPPEPQDLRADAGTERDGRERKLLHWDRTADLEITVPTLTIGARYDTMDPNTWSGWPARCRTAATFYCPNGSHLALYDDQQVYMKGVIDFIRDVDAGRY